MKNLSNNSWLIGLVVVCSAGLTQAETKVELKNTHLCCGACVKAVNKVLDATGVKGTTSQDDGTVTFTAADEKAAQKVLDELAAAGFHGDTGNKELNIKDNSGAKEGLVESLTLKGLHNCCGACNTAIKGALKEVEGVASNDAKPKSDTLTVKGKFDAKAVVKALNDAGFHATVSKE